MRILVLSQSRSRSNWAVNQLYNHFGISLEHFGEPYKALSDLGTLTPEKALQITHGLSQSTHCIVKLEIGQCVINSKLIDPKLFGLTGYDLIYTTRRDDILMATASVLIAEHFRQWTIEDSVRAIAPSSIEFNQAVQRQAATRMFIQHRALIAYQNWMDSKELCYHSYDYSNIDHLCRNWDPNPNATIALEYNYPVLWKDWESLVADVDWSQNHLSNLITWG